MDQGRKKIMAIVIISALGILIIAAIYFQFFQKNQRRYPLLSEIYTEISGYSNDKELTKTTIYLMQDNQIIFHYLVADTITVADTGRFSYNEKTGFLSTSDWSNKYPFRDRRIRIMNQPDPVITIGKSKYVRSNP